MIIRFNVPVPVGISTTFDFHEGDAIYADRPCYVIREATEEEWIADRVEQGYDEESARRESIKRRQQFPESRCYEVSVD